MSFHALELKEEYGDVLLSIIAGPFAYSTPRTHADEYTAVEIALLHKKDMVLPSAIGLSAGFDSLFEPGACPVAGFVSWADVDRVRDALKARAAK